MASISANPLNEAAWLMSKKQHPFSVSSAPFPTPGPGDLVIKVHAVALNPVDCGVQDHGIILTEDQYPAILGCDVSGTIHSLGSEVSTTFSNFKIGDRIIAVATASSQYRGFQSYCAVPASLSSHIPSTTSFTEASVLPLCLCTAAVALFQPLPGLALSLPSTPAAPAKHSMLLIWGGSSSVGCCAIQLAVAAGYEVLTTASAHNTSLCTTVGASHVFDHTQADVVEKILSTLLSSDKPFAGAMSAIMTNDVLRTCADIVSRVPGGRKHVATVMVPPMPFPEDLPEGVDMTYCNSTDLQTGDLGRAIWGSWVPDALKSGQLQCLPPVQIVGKGLESAQEAVDLMRKGVSGRKLVVELL